MSLILSCKHLPACRLMMILNRLRSPHLCHQLHSLQNASSNQCQTHLMRSTEFLETMAWQWTGLVRSPIQHLCNSEVFIKCDRSWTSEHTFTGKRKASSKRIGCPFELKLNYTKVEHCWRVIVKNSHHNHGPTHPITRISYCQEAILHWHPHIKSMFNSGLAVRQILDIILR